MTVHVMDQVLFHGEVCCVERMSGDPGECLCTLRPLFITDTTFYASESECLPVPSQHWAVGSD